MSHHILMLTDGRHPRQTELFTVVLREQWSLTVVSYQEQEFCDAVKHLQPAVIIVAPHGGDFTWIRPLIQLTRWSTDIAFLVHPQDDDSSYSAGAALVGASGHLRRCASTGMIMDAIKALAGGELVWPPADLAQAAESLLAWQRSGLIPRALACRPDVDDDRHQATLIARRCRLARAMLRYAESEDEVQRAIDAAICLGLPLFEVEQALEYRKQVVCRRCRPRANRVTWSGES